MGRYAESFNSFDEKQHGTIGHLVHALQEHANEIERLNVENAKCRDLIIAMSRDVVILRNHITLGNELIRALCEYNGAIPDNERKMILDHLNIINMELK